MQITTTFAEPGAVNGWEQLPSSKTQSGTKLDPGSFLSWSTTDRQTHSSDKKSIDGQATKISQPEAQQALNRLVSDHGSIDLSQLNMGMLNSIAGQITMSVAADMGKIIGKQISRGADVQEFLRDKRVDDYQKQIDKSVEQADKAHKAGIFNAVFDWIVGAVEVIYGALKIVEGIATGNPLAITAGAAYIGAGVAGLVKAAAETCLLAGVGDKKALEKTIEVAGYVQLGFECFAMAVDLFQAGRAINAARGAVKGASSALKGGTAEALSTVVGQSAGKAATAESQQIIKQLGQFVAQEASAQVTSDITKSLTKAGMEKLVSGAVEQVVMKAIEKGASVSAKELTTQIERQVLKEIVKTVLKDLMVSGLQQLGEMTKVARGVNTGQLAIVSAKLRAVMEHLVTDQNISQTIEEWTEKNKQQQQQELQNITKMYGDGVASISNSINQSAMLQNTITNSMV